MKEAVHIFLKDTRQLRFPIAIVLAWTAIFLVVAAATPAPFLRFQDWLGRLAFGVLTVSNYVLPVGWWFLISRAFHADAIPGSRQFWLTRPYSRSSLLGAKALFVVAYITLPLALAQTAVVLFRGFPLSHSIPGLLWSQLMILAIVVLPAAALASLTSKLTQFVVAGLAAPLLFLANNLLRSWGAFEWVRASIAIGIVVTATSTVLFVQFARRRTGTSRLIATAGILGLVAALALTPWRAAFALQSQITADWNGRLSAVLVKSPPREGRAAERIGPLSFQIVGLPAATPIACAAAEATIEGQDGVWQTGLRIGRTGAMSTISDGCILTVSDALAGQVGTRQVNIHAILYITVFGADRPTTVPIDQPPTIVPSAGLCSGVTYTDLIRARSETVDNSATLVSCQSVFRDPRVILLSSRKGSELLPGRVSYSPFPADLRIAPVDDVAYFNSEPVASMTVFTREPVAHVRAVVDVRDVYLQDFLR